VVKLNCGFDLRLFRLHLDLVARGQKLVKSQDQLPITLKKLFYTLDDTLSINSLGLELLRVAKGCYKDVTRVLQGRYKGVTRVLQGCYKASFVRTKRGHQTHKQA
jgi:hypothetical protein